MKACNNTASLLATLALLNVRSSRLIDAANVLLEDKIPFKNDRTHLDDDSIQIAHSLPEFSAVPDAAAIHKERAVPSTLDVYGGRTSDRVIFRGTIHRIRIDYVPNVNLTSRILRIHGKFGPVYVPYGVPNPSVVAAPAAGTVLVPHAIAVGSSVG